MKITKERLKTIIQEELSNSINEKSSDKASKRVSEIVTQSFIDLKRNLAKEYASQLKIDEAALYQKLDATLDHGPIGTTLEQQVFEAILKVVDPSDL